MNFYNGSLYTSLPPGGIPPLRDDLLLVYCSSDQQWFYVRGVPFTQTKANLQQIAQDAWDDGIRVLCLNFEDDVTDPANFQRGLNFLDWIKEAVPALPVGYYGYPDAFYYNGSLSPKPIPVLKAGNDARQAILSKATAAFPSLYTVNDMDAPGGMDTWLTYLNLAVEECRRTMPGVKIFPFIRPRYNDGGWYDNPGFAHQGEFMPSPHFLRQLVACLGACSRAVLWAGGEAWDSNAAWYQDIVNTLLAPVSAPAGGEPQSQTFTEAGTFTMPAGVTKLSRVEIWAKGGDNAGGGAAYARVEDYTPTGTTLNIARGSTSSFVSDEAGTFVQAADGGNDHSSGGDAGSCTGDVVFSGGNGGTAAGGGGAGSAGDGSSAGGGGTSGGAGGDPDGGAGGDPGQDGTFPGGGGGEGASGAGWQVIVHWNAPVRQARAGHLGWLSYLPEGVSV